MRLCISPPYLTKAVATSARFKASGLIINSCENDTKKRTRQVPTNTIVFFFSCACLQGWLQDKSLAGQATILKLDWKVACINQAHGSNAHTWWPSTEGGHDLGVCDGKHV
jgi:hypothetical protein